MMTVENIGDVVGMLIWIVSSLILIICTFYLCRELGESRREVKRLRELLDAQKDDLSKHD